MKKIPTGDVTLLFTDIEGSTRLAQDYPEQLGDILEKHNHILRRVIESNSGFVFETIGDAFCCAFENSDDALKAAAHAQAEIEKETWANVNLKVRMGLNTGNIQWNGSRYVGYLTLAKSNRVMSAAYGGQILISDSTYESLLTKNLNEFSFRDLGERRLKDISQPIRLFQAISPGLQTEFPPLKTLDARPNNLPSQLTSFIGRKEEIAAIKQKFKDSRLLTITGPGGAGKTRLALEIASDVIDEFENGVWLMELASVSDPESLPEVISCALRIKGGQQKKGSSGNLLEFLKDKKLLLIFDTCEHIIKACASLCERILQQSPEVKIIATSREALKCKGEKTHIVEPLSFPEGNKDIKLDEVKKYEAIRLFIERASMVSSTFKPSEENAHLLVQICSRLEGIPLAIELAAARVKVLSLEKISERLEDRFKLLTGGERTALPRQQTLRALIDWSYDLLTHEEKILWRRLSVFSGGWSFEAAEKVCADEILEMDLILDLLSNLNEKSLVIFDEENDWYRMLETIKSYGTEKLVESNEHEIISEKLLDYLIQFAGTAEAETMGPKQKEVLEQYEKNNSNFENALAWACHNNKAEEGLVLAGGLGVYWRLRGHFQTGRKWLQTLLELKAKTSHYSRAKALNWAGSLANRQGNNGIAKKYLEESLALYRETGEQQGIASSLYRLGFIYKAQNQWKMALKVAEECLEIYRGLKDSQGISSSTNLLGILHHERNEPDIAMKYYYESLEISQKGGDKQGIAVCLLNIAFAAASIGNNDEARKLYIESLDLFREIGDIYDAAVSLHRLGDLEAEVRNYEASEKAYLESIDLRKQMNDKPGIASCYYSIARIKFDMKNYSGALENYKSSLRFNSETGKNVNILRSIMGISGTQFVMNKLQTAAMLLGKFQDSFSKTNLRLDDFEQHLLENTWMGINKDPQKKKLLKSFEEGKKLSLEQTIEAALKVES